MATRSAFLRQAWDEIINPPMQEQWIGSLISESQRHPNAPFADLGPALERLLALGAAPRDLSLIARFAAYEAVFQILYMLDDPGIDDGDDAMLHESLLSADPSGKEGRPGSAPGKRH
jgi:hypothetical protein